MTTVNVSTQVNTVTVTDSSGSTVVESPVTSVVTASTAGPQGAQGPTGDPGIVLDTSAKVDGSVIYYHSSGNTFRADANWTTDTLTDGGNF